MKVSKHKSVLAKLLAQENIVVHQDPSVSTASFDVANRVLTLPLLKAMENSDSIHYDGFILHEIGHALYSEYEDWVRLAGKFPHSVMNILEDVRINKLVMKLYPAAKRIFSTHYRKLFERGFYSVDQNTVNGLGFYDKVNIHFKVGSLAGVEFNEKEQKYVELIDSIVTVEDLERVLNILKEEEVRQEEGEDENAGGAGEEDETEKEEGDTDIAGDAEESVEGEEGESTEPGDGASEESDKAEGDLDDGVDFSAPESQNDFDDKFGKEFIDDSNSRHFNYIDKIVDTSEYTVGYKELLDNQDDYYKKLVKNNIACEDVSHFFRNALDKFEHDVKVFEKESKASVSFLVKAFERKKSADDYAKTAISKTGTLDMRVLHNYKLTEDVFKKNEIVPTGKNHGLFMVFDNSGSMSGANITNVIKQILILTAFARNVGIPFEVYTFTSGGQNGFSKEGFRSRINFGGNEVMQNLELYSPEMLQVMSSTMSNKDYKRGRLFLYRYMQTHGHFGLGDVSDSHRYNYYHRTPPLSSIHMGGTPLDSALMVSSELVSNFKRKNNIDLVSFMMLTDGEGQHTSVTGGAWNSTGVVVDNVTGNHYKIDSRYGASDKTFYQIVKDRTGAKVISFFIGHKTEVRKQVKRRILETWDNGDPRLKKGMSKFNKTGLLSARYEGVDKYIFMKDEIAGATGEESALVGFRKEAQKRSLTRLFAEELMAIMA